MLLRFLFLLISCVSHLTNFCVAVNSYLSRFFQGILFKDYLDFFSFLVNIRDVDMALSFHTVAGQAIDPGNNTLLYKIHLSSVSTWCMLYSI